MMRPPRVDPARFGGRSRCASLAYAALIPHALTLHACGGHGAQAAPTGDAAIDVTSTFTDGGMESSESTVATYTAVYQSMNWFDDAGNGTINDVDKAWHWAGNQC